MIRVLPKRRYTLRIVFCFFFFWILACTFQMFISSFPGACEDQVNGFICNCAGGFSGIRCEEDIDDCQSSPCVNGVYLSRHSATPPPPPAKKSRIQFSVIVFLLMIL